MWTGFVRTAGNHLAPTGSIGKVRTVKASDDLTYMVIDFNVKNDSDRDMIVRDVEAVVDTAAGSVTGSPVAARDVAAAFKNYPLLGEQYNPVLKERDVIPAHGFVDLDGWASHRRALGNGGCPAKRGNPARRRRRYRATSWS